MSVLARSAARIHAQNCHCPRCQPWTRRERQSRLARAGAVLALIAGVAAIEAAGWALFLLALRPIAAALGL